MKEEIVSAANGLLFISESEHPLEYILLGDGSIEEQIRSLSTHKNGVIETQSLDYFFRNATKEREGEDTTSAKKFQQLQKVLESNLTDIKVYRVGEVQIDAFIIGKARDGSHAGLRTKLIET